MIKPLAIALACAATTVAVAFPVKAADLLATYTGAITAENADDTVFGGHADVGATLIADFYYTTSIPGTRTTLTGGSDEVSGGLAFGTDSVITKAVFKSGAYTFSFTPDYYSDVYASPRFLDAYAIDTNGANSQTYIMPDNPALADLEAPFSSTGVGDLGGQDTQYSFVSDGNTTVDFDATRVVISAAPEPEAWTLMLLGVGAVGLLLRRRAWRARARLPSASAAGLALRSRTLSCSAQ